MLLRAPPSASISFSPHLLRRLPLLPAPSWTPPILHSFKPLKTLLHLPTCKARGGDAAPLPLATISDANGPGNPWQHQEEAEETEVARAASSSSSRKSFWGAVSLIVGTAVGPGMLGLPSATIRSGPVPSTITIILCWVYVVSSIILVAELSFAAMREDGVDEVSFTTLATKALGPGFGALTAVVYASLSFSLIVACVSGIGSLVLQRFPLANPVVAHAAFPCFVGAVIGFFPFKAIDATNRLLCALMLCSISAIVAIGLSIGRSNLLHSLAFASWRPEAILPAIPVTVLTLGFHVITPFVCKIVGDSSRNARKAILLGGAVPLMMVLSWNAVVLWLSGANNATFDEPIKLLLSVNSSALPAVQGFAFAALATSLIGYAVSFPKQLADTVNLIAQQLGRMQSKCSCEGGTMGFTVYLSKKEGSVGKASYSGYESTKLFSELNQGGAETMLNGGSSEEIYSEKTNELVVSDASSSSILVTWLVLIVPIFIASFFRAAFAKALDFAGVYANCFLFGILPPAMAGIHRSRKRHRSPTSTEDLLPGGSFVLVILFSIAVLLGFWH